MSARRSRSWTNCALAASGVPSYGAWAPRAVRSNSATVTFWLPTVMIGLPLDEQPASASDSDAATSASAAGRDTGFPLLECAASVEPAQVRRRCRTQERRLARPSHLLHHRGRISPGLLGSR